ncbi:hypothetical protein M8818_000064 [Zalaria obscura]|uniref:Uncharacterized protein n=1 Tax=Zalaria obscura TaxID=2024903 RepID=A0ACC3SP27_9PEZI
MAARKRPRALGDATSACTLWAPADSPKMTRTKDLASPVKGRLRSQRRALVPIANLQSGLKSSSCLCGCLEREKGQHTSYQALSHMSPHRH